jgi:hypothetical protein
MLHHILNNPYIKIICSDKYTDSFEAKLKKKGDDKNAYELEKMEFENNPKLKDAVKKYLEDNEIKCNFSNVNIGLCNSFDKKYFNKNKKNMYETIKQTMEELNSQSQTKQSPKVRLDSKCEDSSDEEVEANSRKSKKQNLKSSIKEKEPKKEETKPKSKFNNLKIKEDSEDNDDFSFDSEDQ